VDRSWFGEFGGAFFPFPLVASKDFFSSSLFWCLVLTLSTAPWAFCLQERLVPLMCGNPLFLCLLAFFCVYGSF